MFSFIRVQYSWPHKSLANRLFAVSCWTKDASKRFITGLLGGESAGDQWTPPHKEPAMRKTFPYHDAIMPVGLSRARARFSLNVGTKQHQSQSRSISHITWPGVLWADWHGTNHARQEITESNTLCISTIWRQLTPIISRHVILEKNVVKYEYSWTHNYDLYGRQQGVSLGNVLVHNIGLLKMTPNCPNLVISQKLH